MSRVFVALGKNIKNAVALYKKTISEIRAISIKATAIEAFLDFKI